MPKATGAEIERRVDKVYDLLITGVTYRAIIGYGADKWGVRERQMNVYIRRARERIRELMRESQEDQLARAVAAYDSLIAHQLAAQDFGGARLTMESRCRLLGLSAKDRKSLEVSWGIKGYVGIEPEDV